MQDEFLVRKLYIEDDDRISECIGSLVAHDRCRLDDEAMMPDDLALSLARRHVDQMLRLHHR